MPGLEEIKRPVAGELSHYEEYMKNALMSGDSLVNTMIAYILESRGKAVRPLMAILSASMFKRTEALPDRSHLAAMLLELIHTASLVHDDVIDDSDLRRGKPSVNALWQTQRAVLIGDYILARSFSAGMKSGSYDLVAYISGSMGELCEGELMQSQQSDNLGMDRAAYDRIIYKKTATLIGVSCGAGAMSVGADEVVGRMQRLGDSVGMAFQIKDDILDYTPSANTGKPACGDLRERKINLPLLMVMEKAEEPLRKKILSLLGGVKTSPENVEALYSIVTENQGIEMAEAEMDKYALAAKDILLSFPHSVYRDSMEGLIDYVTAREK